MRVLALLLLFDMSACTSVNPPKQLIPVSMPYKSDLPEFNLIVEEIPFLADFDAEAEKAACRNVIISKQSLNVGDLQGLRDCHANYTCSLSNSKVGIQETVPAMYIGQKLVPGYYPSELKAQLTSALKGIGNLKVLMGERASSPKGSPLYLIRAKLTEYNVSSNKDSSGFGGMGVGPLSIFQLVNVEKIQKTGFVRFDIRIVDINSGRILSAFSVGGSATDAYVNEGTFSGMISENVQFVPMLMHQATRAALNEGAKRIFAELNQK